MNNKLDITISRIAFVLIMSLWSGHVFAQRDVADVVNLNGNNTTEKIDFKFCSIQCSVIDGFASSADVSRVSMEIENTIDDDCYLLMFDKPYNETKLKANKPSIRFDNGSNLSKIVEPVVKLTKSIVVEPNGKCDFSFSLNNGEVDSVKLVFYIAKKKKMGFLFWRKEVYNILQREVRTIPIAFNDNNPQLGSFFKDYKKLKEDVSHATFCKSPKHRPVLNDQIKPFKKRKDDLIARIETWRNQEEISFNNKSSLYDKSRSLIDSINSIVFESLAVDDCGDSHIYASPHKCKYCNYTLEQIYNKLDEYYKEVYNSSDRKKVKSEIINDVNLLYKCCTDKRCRNHANSWKTSEYNQKITDIYQRINRY